MPAAAKKKRQPAGGLETGLVVARGRAATALKAVRTEAEDIARCQEIWLEAGDMDPVDAVESGWRMAMWAELRAMPWWIPILAGVLGIRTKGVGGGRLVPNASQVIAMDHIIALWKKELCPETVALKVRKNGYTTLFAACDLCLGLWHDGTNCLIVANIQPSAQNVLSMVRGMWQSIPEALRPGDGDPKTTDNVDLLRIKDADAGMPLGSMWKAEADAQGKNVCRSGGYKWLHATECGFWTRPKETLPALEGGIYEDFPAFRVWESTNDDGGSFFAKLFKSVHANPEVNQVAVFIPFHVREDCHRALDEDKITPEQLWAQLPPDVSGKMQRYRVPVTGANWWRKKFQSDRAKGITVEKMLAEFPVTPDDAMALAAAATVFDKERLGADYKRVHAQWALGPLSKVGVLVGCPVKVKETRIMARCSWSMDTTPPVLVDNEYGGEWIIYELPMAGHRYVVPCDPAGGKAGSGLARSGGRAGRADEAVMGVWRVTSEAGVEPDAMIQAAQFRSRTTDAVALAHQMAWMSELYPSYGGGQQTLLVPEAKGHGLVVIQELLKLGTVNIYQPVDRNGRGEVVHQSIGVETAAGKSGASSKYRLVVQGRGAYDTGLVRVHSEGTLDQMSIYQSDGVGFSAPDTEHDDCVMEMCLAVEGLRGSSMHYRVEVEQVETATGTLARLAAAGFDGLTDREMALSEVEAERAKDAAWDRMRLSVMDDYGDGVLALA